MPHPFIIHRSAFIISLRHRHVVQDLLHHILTGFLLGFGFVRHDDAVPQHVVGHFLHVLRRDVTATGQKRRGLGTQRQVDRGPREAPY